VTQPFQALANRHEAASSRKSILVVADQKINSMLVTNLAKSDWDVEYAGNNDGALSLLAGRKFDLIVTSEGTSAKQDVELLRQIRRIHPHTRMIILTDESTPQDVVAALRERAFSMFSKPYSSDVLFEMIRRAVEEPCWDDGIEVISATPNWIQLIVRCELGTAERLLQFFMEFVELPDEEKNKVGYAFREMLLNAMRHGAGFDPTQYVEISYLKARHVVACRVKDPGRGFSLNELYHAAITNPIDNPVRHMMYREASGLPPGGYGILLSRHAVDELIYNEQGNEVLLMKYLYPPTPEEPH